MKRVAKKKKNLLRRVVGTVAIASGSLLVSVGVMMRYGQEAHATWTEAQKVGVAWLRAGGGR